MIRSVCALLRRAMDILESEGLRPLLVRGLHVLRERMFRYGTYYLYEHSLEERDESQFLPRVDGFTLQIVCSNEEADQLATTIGFDFRRRFIDARRCLDKGATAFCVFANGEIAHIGWVAFSEEAKKCFDRLPYEVDFLNKVACTGGTETVPKYGGKGLMTYGYFKRLEYLRQLGWQASRNAVDVNNISSQKAHAKFRPRVLAKARHVYLLGWESWKETPPEPIDSNR